jgi:PAS domain S-box-containing protein
MAVAQDPPSTSGHLTARLFAKYAAISLLPVCLAGLAFAVSLRDQAHQRALSSAQSVTRLVAETAIDPVLDARPLGASLNAAELAGLRRMAQQTTAEKLILQLRVMNLAGQVVFPSGVGPPRPLAAHDAFEAAHGKPVAYEISSAGGRTPHPASFEVYQPLYAGGVAHVMIGVLGLGLPYAPIYNRAAANLERVYLYLALGLALLYLALLAITLSVSRGLRRQAAINAAQAERLRVSEQEHRLLFEQNPEPMLAYDRRTFEIVAVSNAAVATYGYSREEFCALTIKDIRPPDDVPRLLDHLNARGAQETGISVGTQTRHQYKDGTIIDVEITGDDVTLYGRECRIVLCQNVTARNKATRDLAIARDEAIEASNTKSAFLANVSHEIRTPMNGVIGMNQLLLDTGLDDEQRAYAEQVARSGEQMLTIINDILDISKIEAGQLELDLADFDLHDTIEQACAVAGIEATAKKLAFNVEVGPDVPRYACGDSVRLRQIVVNLVANAVKFTSDGSIKVRASSPRAGEDGIRLRVEIADTGIGIDPEALDVMFEKFTQADSSTTRNYGGTGLGLAIARELSELMGGAIGAESEAGRGSTFWFEVQLAAATSEPGSRSATSATAATATPHLGASSPLVLVAEDTPVNQVVAVRALQRCGCRAHVVNDGSEALQALSTQHYDAILMDCQMPVMDGYETTTELRRREADGPRTPVIAMTAYAMKGDVEKCLAAGMDDYLSKPLRHQALADALARWMTRPTETVPDSDDAQPTVAVASQ